MRRNGYFLAGLVLATLVTLNGCSNTDYTDLSVTHVSGVITSDVTWKSGRVYMVDDDVIVEDATLTIEPGTIVKFAAGTGLIAQGVDGVINAVGTYGVHIVFTSSADDNYGGDSDDYPSYGEGGDWQDIFINPSSGAAVSRFSYCDIFYGGQGSYANSAMMSIGYSNAEIDHCTFAHSARAALNIEDAKMGTTVTNSVFYDNTKPLWMNPDFSMAGSNRFYNPSSPSVTNRYNGIWLQDGVTITDDRDWGDNGVPYVSNTGFTIAAGVFLFLADGVDVKFVDETASVDLGSNAGIYNLAGAYLTSYYDDAHGGDTNEDGSVTHPLVGDWDGVYSNSAHAWVIDGHILYSAH